MHVFLTGILQTLNLSASTQRNVIRGQERTKNKILYCIDSILLSILSSRKRFAITMINYSWKTLLVFRFAPAEAVA